MTHVIWKSQKNSDLSEKSFMIVESIGWQVRIQPHIWSPPTDIFDLENNYVVRVEIAGMHRQDINIQLEENYLVIWGTRRDKPDRRAYHQMEVRFGEFSTVVSIPGPVLVDQSSAEYNDGFLVVTLPKLEPEQF